VSRWWRLPASEQAVLLGSLAAYPFMAAAVLFAGFGATSRLVARVPNAPVRSGAPAIVPDRIARLVARGTRFWPSRGRCLPNALIAAALLRRAGYRPAVRLGARKTGASLDGHAWLELDGRALAELPEAIREYHRLV
jgi:hypothetical protein